MKERGEKTKYNERVQKLAKEAFLKPKKYKSAKEAYPLDHFKKRKMDNVG